MLSARRDLPIFHVATAAHGRRSRLERHPGLLFSGVFRPAESELRKPPGKGRL